MLSGLGEHSLSVFAVGVALSGLGGWALFAWGQGFAAQVAVNVAGIASLTATASLAKPRPGLIGGPALGSPPRRAPADALA